MFKLENLLRNEYFPSELPPCFNSNSFADNHENIKTLVESIKLSPSDPLTFSGYKNSNSRRKFSIPNPVHYANAANIIVNNSNAIFDIINKSEHSVTAPLDKTPDKNECYKKKAYSYKDLKDRIKKLYTCNRYEIRLDIQSFFDSVYTHSIAWAIHTKDVAKKNKKNQEFLGNKLDASLQIMNSGQTNGILTGNAISRIASEIILSTVDTLIHNKYPKINFLRYVDDYFIFVKEPTLMDDITSFVRQELAKYSLYLNENKINFNSSPFVYGKSWVEEMRVYSCLQPELLIEKAIIEYHKYEDISILRYALQVIRGICFNKKKWNEIQPIILNILVSFPNLSDIITIILKNNAEYVKLSVLKQCIYTILDNNVKLKNDEEVIWAVWLCKIFNIKLSLNYIIKVLDTDNWVAIIILLDIISKKKNELPVKKATDKFRRRIIEEYFDNNNDGMNTDIWLLAYECEKNKWLNTSGVDIFDKAHKNQYFKKLKELNIDFYKSDYEYVDIANPEYKSNIYVTRKELMVLLEEYKKLNDNITDNDAKNSTKIIVKNDIFEKIKEALRNNDSFIY